MHLVSPVVPEIVPLASKSAGIEMVEITVIRVAHAVEFVLASGIVHSVVVVCTVQMLG
jgi:hypothetical protein